jgi:hypothetical protein
MNATKHLRGCGDCGYNESMTTLRARFDGRVLIPEGPVDLPVDKPLDIQVSEATEGSYPQGSPEAILEVLRSLTPISPDAYAEFERALEEGKLPPTERGIFDDETDENPNNRR